jgi:hypothetical protein
MGVVKVLGGGEFLDKAERGSQQVLLHDATLLTANL